MWVLSKEDTRIPNWLYDNLNHICNEVGCGFPMENRYNETDGRCTSRRCSNQSCPSKLALRANWCAKLINIKNIGPAAFKKIIQELNLKNHLEVLEKTIGYKPDIYLDTFMRFLCIENMDKVLADFVINNNITTVEDLLKREERFITENYDYILECSKHVNVLEPEEIKPETSMGIAAVKIMITGHLHDYATKDIFIDYLNDKYKGYFVIFHQVTKKQSGVHFLVKEVETMTRGKVEAAIKGGIKIVTPDELITILDNMKEYMLRQ